MNGVRRVYNNISELSEAAARQWLALSASSISDRGVFRVALAGGNTPRKLYERLAQPDYSEQLDWSNTQIYFGDERCVPQDRVESNYHTAEESLLSKITIPPENVHPMYDPFFSAEENAARYDELVSEFEVFDLILLGMGSDGHTASLFPGTEILDETKKYVAAQYVDQLLSSRISFTFRAINAARNVFILVSGDGKAEVISNISRSGEDSFSYPVQSVDPQGSLVWYLDKSASSKIL